MISSIMCRDKASCTEQPVVLYTTIVMLSATPVLVPSKYDTV